MKRARPTVPGPYVIQRDDEAVTMCEEPHPVRFSMKRRPEHEYGEPWERRWAVDRWPDARGYRCPGDQDHFYTVWTVYNGADEDEANVGTFDEYREAVAACDDANREANRSAL